MEEFTFEQINSILRIAVSTMYAIQTNIFEFTSQTGQTEWNLTYHLAHEIHRFLPAFNCDVDVTKRNRGNMRPDIIFHKRGRNACNLLVVELKYKGNNTELKDDVNKIITEWFSGALNYKFGASINLIDKTHTGFNILSNADWHH